MPGAGEPSISISSGSGSTITGGSPKMIYTIFLIGLCKSHFESMAPDKLAEVNYKTAALIAYCPNKEKRDELWREVQQGDRGQSGYGKSRLCQRTRSRRAHVIPQ